MNKKLLIRRVALATVCVMTLPVLAADHDTTAGTQRGENNRAPDGTPTQWHNAGHAAGKDAAKHTKAEKFAKDAAMSGLMEVHLGQLALQKAQNDRVRQFGQRMVTDHSQANQRLMQIAQSKGIVLPPTNAIVVALASGPTNDPTRLPVRDPEEVRDPRDPLSTTDFDRRDMPNLRQGAGARNQTEETAPKPTNDTAEDAHAQHRAILPDGHTDANWHAANEGDIHKEHLKMARHLETLSGAEFDKAYMNHMVKDHAKDIAKFEVAAKNLEDPELKQFANDTLPTLREHARLAKDVRKELGEDRDDHDRNVDKTRKDVRDRDETPAVIETPDRNRGYDPSRSSGASPRRYGPGTSGVGRSGLDTTATGTSGGTSSTSPLGLGGRSTQVGSPRQ